MAREFTTSALTPPTSAVTALARGGGRAGYRGYLHPGRLRTYVVSALVLLTWILASGSSSDDIAALVQQLSWDSIRYDHFKVWAEAKAPGAPSTRLISIGKAATPLLIQAMTDPDRGVAAHLVLCAIYHPNRIESSEGPIHGDHGLIVGSTHTSYGLTWHVDFKFRAEDIALLAKTPLTGDERKRLFANAKEVPSVAARDLQSVRAKWCGTIPHKYRDECESMPLRFAAPPASLPQRP